MEHARSTAWADRGLGPCGRRLHLPHCPRVPGGAEGADFINRLSDESPRENRGRVQVVIALVMTSEGLPLAYNNRSL